MSIYDLPPEQQKRVREGLRLDSNYVWSRNALLVVSLLSTICLAFVGWRVMQGKLAMWPAIGAIALFLVTYVYFAIRLVKVRKSTTARLLAMESVKKVKKNKRAGKK